MGNRYRAKPNLIVRADFKEDTVEFRICNPENENEQGELLILPEEEFLKLFDPAP